MKTLEIAAAALQGDLQKLAIISQNLANVQTPGYKRLVEVQRPFATEWDSAALQRETSLDSRPGALRATNHALDAAIDGEGFFAVQTREGRALVRQLSMRVDAEGLLVNDSGLPVLGERGEMRVDRAAGELRVDARGQVFAGDRALGRLQQWRAAGALQPLGGGLYQAADLQPLDNAKVAVGYQEVSNVNSSAEMVRLMETTRHFEAVARTAQGYDEVMEKAIRKLGEM